MAIRKSRSILSNHPEQQDDRLNLRHLDIMQLAYLRAVARSGSVTGAAAALSVAPQTVSGQLGVLE